MPTDVAAPSQTLSRGIRLLEALSASAETLSTDDIAAALGVHRSIAYRLIRTFEIHGLVMRDGGGRFSLGAGLAALAAGVARDLNAEALPELTAAANALGMTCFLAIADRADCVTLASVEPRHAVASIAQRPGTRHPLAVGAPGKAILAQTPRPEWPRDVSHATAAEIAAVQARGFATSFSEVIPNLRSVAVPLTLRGRPAATVAAVYVAADREPATIAATLGAAAAAIRSALDG